MELKQLKNFIINNGHKIYIRGVSKFDVKTSKAYSSHQIKKKVSMNMCLETLCFLDTVGEWGGLCNLTSTFIL